MKAFAPLVALAASLTVIAAPAQASRPLVRREAPRQPPPSTAIGIRPPLFTEDVEVVEALEMLADGRITRAKEALIRARARYADREGRAHLDFLIARCDARLGRLEEAETGFWLIAVELPALTGAGLSELADAALRADRLDDAARIIPQITSTSTRFTPLNLALARLLARAKRWPEVIATLDRLEPALFWTWEKARAMRLRADARRGIDGDRVKWHARLADLWRRWPGTSAGHGAERVLLRVLLGGGDPAPLTLDELVDAARGRARRFRGDRGRSLQAAARARFGRQALGFATLLTGESSYRRWPRRVLRDVDEVLPRVRAPVIRDRLRDLAARAWRAREHPGAALAEYRKLGAEAGTPERRAEALLDGGALARRLGRLDAARSFLDRYRAQDADVRSGARPRALWQLAWVAWRAGHLDEAEARLRQLANEHPSALDTSKRTFYERSVYWRARVEQRRGRIPQARALWQFVRERFPRSYYATLSDVWLARIAVDAAPTAAAPDRSAPGLPVRAPGPEESAPVEPDAAAAVALYRMGLPGEARRQLRHLYDLGRLGPGGALFLSALYRLDDDPWRAHWIIKATSALEGDCEGDERDAWLAAFPRPFGPVVRREAREHGLDPLLIWAVMRQESGFRRRARSYAKALGLMQVLHATARLVARKLTHDRPPSRAYVLTPRGNVHFGAAYLRYLLRRFHGSLPLAVAGYNAGPGAVDRWLRERGHLDLDEFVEEIPYNETRGYTRKVIRSYAAYRALYGPRGAADLLHIPLEPPANAAEPVASRSPGERR